MVDEEEAEADLQEPILLWESLLLWKKKMKLDLIIDCGSTHSFLLPKCLRKLGLNQLPTRKMVVELANWKEVVSTYCRGILELNKVEDSKDATQPECLKEFSDVFPEDCTNLLSPRDMDHDIEPCLTTNEFQSNLTRCHFLKL